MKALTFIVLLCTVCIADAQIFLKKKQIASAGVAASSGVAGFYYPTNIPGTTPRGWWVFDDYYTNGANATLTNRLATPVVTLIQATAADRPLLLGNGLGTHKVGVFTGGTVKLQSTSGFTNAQPVSLWVIYSATNTGTFGVVGSASSGSQFYGGHNSPTLPNMLVSASGFNGANLVSNQWYCYTYVFNGASSQIWTNMVLNKTGTVGPAAWTNMVIGIPTTATALTGQVAEWSVYDGAINETTISNLFNYATNTYGSVF